MLTLISVLQYFYSKSQEYYEKSLIESGEISSRYFGGKIVKTPNVISRFQSNFNINYSSLFH